MDEIQERRFEVRRNARVVMHGDPAAASEVWFLLHGYGQLARSMLQSCATLAAPRRLLVAPEALSRFYLRGGGGPVGASWMTREDRAAEIGDQIRYLDGVAEWISAELGCGARTRVAMGFSQGAQAAWRWAAHGATPLARVIGWGSDVPGDLDLATASRLSAVRATLVRGARDAIHTSEMVEKDRERAARAGLELEVFEFDGAHAVDADVLARLAAS